MRILNLTQHVATPEQVDMGVFEPENKKAVQEALTFDNIPTVEDIDLAVYALSKIVKAEANEHNFDTVMIGGAPYLMGPLQDSLLLDGYHVFYSFTKRESVETIKEDGTVEKKSVFKHVGWVKNYE